MVLRKKLIKKGRLEKKSKCIFKNVHIAPWNKSLFLLYLFIYVYSSICKFRVMMCLLICISKILNKTLTNLNTFHYTNNLSIFIQNSLISWCHWRFRNLHLLLWVFASCLQNRKIYLSICFSPNSQTLNSIAHPKGELNSSSLQGLLKALKVQHYELKWIELFPLKRYAQVLTPSTCESNFIWQ